MNKFACVVRNFVRWDQQELGKGFCGYVCMYVSLSASLCGCAWWQRADLADWPLSEWWVMSDRFECSSTESARYHRRGLYKALVRECTGTSFGWSLICGYDIDSIDRYIVQCANTAFFFYYRRADTYLVSDRSHLPWKVRLLSQASPSLDCLIPCRVFCDPFYRQKTLESADHISSEIRITKMSSKTNHRVMRRGFATWCLQHRPRTWEKKMSSCKRPQ